MHKQILNKNRPCVVIFDLGNVLLSFNGGKISGFIARKSGFSDKAVRAYIFGTPLEKTVDKGGITLKAYLARINRVFSCKIRFDEFKRAWCEIFTPNTGVKKIVSALKRNGYRLAILSNTNKPHFEYLKRKYAIIKLFDAYHLSYEMKAIKPQKKVFARVLKFHKREPGSVVFVDDLEKNVKAAGLFGIKALHFTSAARLASDLNKMGIKCQ